LVVGAADSVVTRVVIPIIAMTDTQMKWVRDIGGKVRKVRKKIVLFDIFHAWRRICYASRVSLDDHGIFVISS
jgi:hypothetical protein